MLDMINGTGVPTGASSGYIFPDTAECNAVDPTNLE
jgi:hypothetical protein